MTETRPNRKPRKPTAKAQTKPSRVHVRMYRALEQASEEQRKYKGLLGDCFLIRLEHDGTQSTILIDCGMLLGSTDAAARMQMIAADIVAVGGGDVAKNRPGTLDLLVVTHEHWDHISGFSQASGIFFDPAKLKIANLWMAWTEDPDDEKAKTLRAKFDKSTTAFTAMAARLRNESARFGADAAKSALNGLDGFMGIVDTMVAADGKKTSGQLAGREIMDKLKTSSLNPPNFLDPGTVLATPGEVSLRAFVLGPPRDEKRLFKDKPSSGAAQETYFDEPSIDGSQLLKFAHGEDPDPERDSPFAKPYCRIVAKKLEDAAAAGKSLKGPTEEWFGAKYYGVPPTNAAADAARRRRRIDTDWLGTAGRLALKLDSDTNNTSLVLAFELPDETVMLFAADAQVGNWLSWHDQDYGVGDKRISAENLLNRTCFYKVGHHGSHNATLDAQGLAMMQRDDLVAAIPTDEEFGKRQGSSGWQMPNPRVKAALLERTKGRILRNDRRYSEAARVNDPELKGVEKRFFDKIGETDLYLEYRVL